MRKHSPSIVFLMETKTNDEYVKNLTSKLHLDNVHIVPRHNTRCMLALFWEKEIKINILDSSLSHIDAVVNPGVDDTWQITGFYGNPIIANQEHS